MAIIIIDAKPSPQLSDTTSETLDVPPPRYDDDHQPPASPATFPPNTKSAVPSSELIWWRRWLRSPIAISLVFLGCAVIATGVGLAIRFTKNGKPDGNYPGPSQSNYTGGPDGFGPLTANTKTIQLPLDTLRVQFISQEVFVDGFSFVEVGPSNQSIIEIDISMTWRDFMLSSVPVIGSSSNDGNSSVTISCPYTPPTNTNVSVFVYTNVTLRFPPNYVHGSLDLRSASEPPHSWDLRITNMTAGDVSFDNVYLESNAGDFTIVDITTGDFDATTQTGTIAGKVDASRNYEATSKLGIVDISNTYVNSTGPQGPQGNHSRTR